MSDLIVIGYPDEHRELTTVWAEFSQAGMHDDLVDHRETRPCILAGVRERQSCTFTIARAPRGG